MTSSTICSHHRIRTVLLMCVVLLSASLHAQVWGIERSGFFNDRGKWAKGFENQRV